MGPYHNFWSDFFWKKYYRGDPMENFEKKIQKKNSIGGTLCQLLKYFF